jgi:hypothetical protein
MNRGDPIVRTAYLIVSHRGPDQVLRLVRTLREGPGAHVLVRHDQRRSRLDPGELERAGGCLHLDDLTVEWGSWTYLRMLIGGLERIEAEVDPDWTLVISGQDYPLRPLAEIESRLAAAEHDAFLGVAWELETERTPPPPAGDFFRRYAYAHMPLPHRTPRLPGRLAPVAYRRDLPPPLRPRLGVRRLRLPFGPNRRCWVSTDWPVLGRRALHAVLRAAREERALMRHYRHTVVPSESFFATVLMNDPALRVSLGDRRLTSFAPGSPHPDVLRVADLDRLRDSGAHFARKFDAEVDAAVLDRLDELRHPESPR